MSLRLMKTSDADAVYDIMGAAFDDLSQRLGHGADPPPANRAPGLGRIRHLIDTDPEGAWVTETDGVVDGGALALLREGLWGLSLLVVQPGAQSSGQGSALLRAAVDYGADARGGIILASEDSRALRAYWRTGHALRPCFDALGVLEDPPPMPEAVRPGRWPEDAPIVDAASRAVRGAAASVDITPSLATGSKLWIHADGGFSSSGRGGVRMVAAHDPLAARELLRAAVLAAGAGGQRVYVGFIEAQQQWAFDELLSLRLQLRPGGAIAVRGEVGPLYPYLPSGAYL
ncbi:MAG: hypothetical protein QOF76_3261 [Solirubrobacteraceae bacterium]|jgi:GNAT superfamily N-acetyltransferase|nr:hypothetical protein [Solirubrobacteraceae bacterium]